jgi:hypothetical protein
VLLVELHVAGRPRRFAAPWPVPWKVSGRGASVGLEELGPWEVAPTSRCYLERFAAAATGTTETGAVGATKGT